MILMAIFKKLIRIIFRIIKWVLIFMLVLISLSAIYNLWLPDSSRLSDRLPPAEKAYIQEAMQLQRQLGDSIWPGWGALDIPVIVYNEAYAFLLGYPEPPAGWMKMPQEEYRGAAWEAVIGDDFAGSTYYRQPLPDSRVTPENFTVLVGSRWVATIQTKEYAAVAFYNGFREELPPLLKAIFPYKVFWNMVMGTAENYVSGLVHEAFHAYQGSLVPEKLEACETIAWQESSYPWDDPVNAAGWITESDMLMQAYKAEDHAQSIHLTRHFLEQRKIRRHEGKLTEKMILYEQRREWLEGLAKYAELKIGTVAERNNDYEPVTAIKGLKGFKGYKTRSKHLQQQLGEVLRSARRHGESRFYYGGMLQGMLLDRLLPDWKERAFDEGIYLENLLEQAVARHTDRPLYK
jgi:hypothetical protein